MLKHDESMFRMAQLRRDIFAYTRDKYSGLNKRDAEYLLNLINISSYIISNHKSFYSNEFSYKKIKQFVINTIREVDETTPDIYKIKNKRIKAFYVEFGEIMLDNIKKNVPFLKVKIILINKYVQWKRNFQQN